MMHGRTQSFLRFMMINTKMDKKEFRFFQWYGFIKDSLKKKDLPMFDLSGEIHSHHPSGKKNDPEIISKIEAEKNYFINHRLNILPRKLRTEPEYIELSTYIGTFDLVSFLLSHYVFLKIYHPEEAEIFLKKHRISIVHIKEIVLNMIWELSYGNSNGSGLHKEEGV